VFHVVLLEREREREREREPFHVIESMNESLPSLHADISILMMWAVSSFTWDKMILLLLHQSFMILGRHGSVLQTTHREPMRAKNSRPSVYYRSQIALNSFIYVCYLKMPLLIAPSMNN
jgi:hypothetical protein